MEQIADWKRDGRDWIYTGPINPGQRIPTPARGTLWIDPMGRFMLTPRPWWRALWPW